jgi:hypothetical protein
MKTILSRIRREKTREQFYYSHKKKIEIKKIGNKKLDKNFKLITNIKNDLKFNLWSINYSYKQFIKQKKAILASAVANIFSGADKIPFYPYFFVKDIFAFFCFLFLFGTLVFYFRDSLNHLDNFNFIIHFFAQVLCTCAFLGLYYYRIMSLRLFFVSKLYSLNFFHIYHALSFKVILQIILCFLFLALNFSEGGFLFVTHTAFCEPMTDSIAESTRSSGADSIAESTRSSAADSISSSTGYTSTSTTADSTRSLTVESVVEPGGVDQVGDPIILTPINLAGVTVTTLAESVQVSEMTTDDTPHGLVLDVPCDSSVQLSELTRSSDFPADRKMFADFLVDSPSPSSSSSSSSSDEVGPWFEALSVGNVYEPITDSVSEPGDLDRVEDPVIVTPGSPAGVMVTTSGESGQTPAITTADTSSGLVIDTS